MRLDKGSIAEFEFMQPTSHKTKQKQTDAEGKLIVVDTPQGRKMWKSKMPIKDSIEVFVFKPLTKEDAYSSCRIWVGKMKGGVLN